MNISCGGPLDQNNSLTRYNYGDWQEHYTPHIYKDMQEILAFYPSFNQCFHDSQLQSCALIDLRTDFVSSFPYHSHSTFVNVYLLVVSKATG